MDSVILIYTDESQVNLNSETKSVSQNKQVLDIVRLSAPGLEGAQVLRMQQGTQGALLGLD